MIVYVRIGTAYRNGFIKRSEARSKTGFPVEPEDEVYFVEPKKEEKLKDDKEKGKTDEKTDEN